MDNLKSKSVEVFYCADISDAILNCNENDILIYQNEFHSGMKATSNALQRFLLDDFGWQERTKNKICRN